MINFPHTDKQEIKNKHFHSNEISLLLKSTRVVMTNSISKRCIDLISQTINRIRHTPLV